MSRPGPNGPNGDIVARTIDVNRARDEPGDIAPVNLRSIVACVLECRYLPSLPPGKVRTLTPLQSPFFQPSRDLPDTSAQQCPLIVGDRCCTLDQSPPPYLTQSAPRKNHAMPQENPGWSYKVKEHLPSERLIESKPGGPSMSRRSSHDLNPQIKRHRP